MVQTGVTSSTEYTITKLGTAADSPALTAGTDYWIQSQTTSTAAGGAYTNHGGPWAYIRTKAGTPTRPTGCSEAAATVDWIDTVTSTKTTITVTLENPLPTTGEQAPPGSWTACRFAGVQRFRTPPGLMHTSRADSLSTQFTAGEELTIKTYGR